MLTHVVVRVDAQRIICAQDVIACPREITTTCSHAGNVFHARLVFDVTLRSTVCGSGIANRVAVALDLDVCTAIMEMARCENDATCHFGQTPSWQVYQV